MLLDNTWKQLFCFNLIQRNYIKNTAVVSAKEWQASNMELKVHGAHRLVRRDRKFKTRSECLRWREGDGYRNINNQYQRDYRYVYISKLLIFILNLTFKLSQHSLSHPFPYGNLRYPTCYLRVDRRLEYDRAHPKTPRAYSMSGMFAGGLATDWCTTSSEHTYHIEDIDIFVYLYSVISLFELDIVTRDNA